MALFWTIVCVCPGLQFPSSLALMMVSLPSAVCNLGSLPPVYMLCGLWRLAFCAPDYLVFLPCFWIFVWDSLNCTWIFIVWEWRKTVPLMLRRRGHFTTSGVHYFSNNFNGLESQPCIKTLFRWFISRHLSCFHPEISWVLNSFLTHLINLTLQFPKRHFRANNRGLSHWYVGYRSY